MATVTATVATRPSLFGVPPWVNANTLDIDFLAKVKHFEQQKRMDLVLKALTVNAPALYPKAEAIEGRNALTDFKWTFQVLDDTTVAFQSVDDFILASHERAESVGKPMNYVSTNMKYWDFEIKEGTDEASIVYTYPGFLFDIMVRVLRDVFVSN